MVRTLAVFVTAATFGAAGAGAQEIFWDGFDVGDLCAWSNAPSAPIPEQEAFDEHTNDTDADAELIGRCAVIHGTIGDPIDPPGPDLPEPDTDWYEIDVDGPVLLRIRLERRGASSGFEPIAYVLNTGSYPDFGITPPGTPTSDPAVTSRQIYLPQNGFVFLDPPPNDKNIPNNNKWLLNVDDERNYYDESCPCGDADNGYRLTLSIDPVSGPPQTVPINLQTVQTAADGTALIRRLDGAAIPMLDLAETYADRDLDPLDTKLYLVRKSGNALATLAGSDDFDEFVSHFDSKIEDVALTAQPHFLIVDSYAVYDVDPVDFELTIQFLSSLWP
jgi:hypothetical protein